MVTHPSTNLAVHGQESNSQPVDHKSDAPTTTQSSRLSLMTLSLHMSYFGLLRTLFRIMSI